MIEVSIAEPLLTCLRLDSGERKLALLQSLTSAEWEALVDQARLHRLMPLLFWEIKNLPGRISLSPDREQILHNSFVANTSKNMILYRELNDILKALQPAGIPVILLKGIHLAKWIYPEIGLRPMGDIDLLIHRADLSRAGSILQGLGYRFGITFKLEHYIHKYQHVPPLRQSGKAPVELHWHIATPGSPPKIDLEKLWSGARPVDIAGVQAWTLAPEDLLLHLSFHLLQDEFRGGLMRLYDLAALSSFLGDRLDWSQMLQRAGDWNCRKALFLGLHMAFNLLNAPVPRDVLEQLYPPDFSPQIDALAQERILNVSLSPPEVNPDLTRLRRRRPIRAKASRLHSILFPYPEIVAAKLSLPQGTRVTFYHYLIWLKYLVGRYGQQAWRVLRNEKTAAALARSENAISDWWMAG